MTTLATLDKFPYCRTQGTYVMYTSEKRARFICTVCMHRIRRSCEGLTSISQQIHWIQLKHLLLRLMYNLSLPDLMCYSTSCLRPCNCSACCRNHLNDHVNDCRTVLPYIAARVDVSWNSIFWDHSSVNKAGHSSSRSSGRVERGGQET